MTPLQAQEPLLVSTTCQVCFRPRPVSAFCFLSLNFSLHDYTTMWLAFKTSSVTVAYDITLHRSTFLHKQSHCTGGGLCKNKLFLRRRLSGKYPEQGVQLRKTLSQSHLAVVLGWRWEYVSGKRACTDQRGLAGDAGPPKGRGRPGDVPRCVSPGEARSFPGSSEGTTSCWLSLDLHTSPSGQLWTWQAQGMVFGNRKSSEPWAGPYLCRLVHFREVNGEILLFDSFTLMWHITIRPKASWSMYVLDFFKILFFITFNHDLDTRQDGPLCGTRGGWEKRLESSTRLKITVATDSGGPVGLARKGKATCSACAAGRSPQGSHQLTLGKGFWDSTGTGERERTDSWEARRRVSSH